MRRKALLIILVILVLGGILAMLVIPIIDREAMKSPVVNAMNGARSGNLKLIRAQFTADGEVAGGEVVMSIDKALKAAEPLLKSGELQGSARFDGYRDLKRNSPTEVEADFSVIYYLEGNDEIPYNRVPIPVDGRVVLVKTGWFKWKIRQLSSDNSEFIQAIQD